MAAAQRDALRAVAAELKGAERDELMANKGLYSDADYTGPKDWDRSTGESVSGASKRIDDQFPWLKDVFKQSDAQKAAIAKMKAARAGGTWGGDHSSPEARAASAAARAEKEAAAAAKVLKKQMIVAEPPVEGLVRGVLDETTVQEIKTKAQRQADYSRARYDQMKAEKGLPPACRAIPKSPGCGLSTQRTPSGSRGRRRGRPRPQNGCASIRQPHISGNSMQSPRRCWLRAI